MTKQIINPPNYLPAQGVKVGNTVYISGQVAWDKDHNVVGGADAKAQAEKVFSNMGEVLKAAGATFKDIVKVTTFLTNLQDMGKVFEVRRRFFEGHTPASTTVVVTQLARPELLLEVEAIVVIE